MAEISQKYTVCGLFHNIDRFILLIFREPQTHPESTATQSIQLFTVMRLYRKLCGGACLRTVAVFSLWTVWRI